MENIISGKTFCFGDNIDTDQIYPGRYLEITNPQEIKIHCLEGADPEFINRMSSGDIVVAGRNFGCGSSREHAVIALVNTGVGAIVAESFARIFYRNAINLGLPVVVCPDIRGNINSGDVLDIRLEEGLIINQTLNKKLHADKISPYVMEILKSGGIKPLFKKK